LPIPRSDRNRPSIGSDGAPEEWVSHLALGRLGAVLDLGEQFRLYPDALVRDPFSVGLGFSDQGRETLTQFGG